MARRVYKLADKGFSAFNGMKLFYVGFAAQPKLLAKEGRGFTGLKHILELLGGQFKKFTLTITPKENSAVKVGRVTRVRLAEPLLRTLMAEQIKAGRPVKLRVAKEMLGKVLPKHFDAQPHFIYEKGMFRALLDRMDTRALSADDRAAITAFVHQTLPDTVGLDVASVYDAKRDLQLIYLGTASQRIRGCSQSRSQRGLVAEVLRGQHSLLPGELHPDDREGQCGLSRHKVSRFHGSDLGRVRRHP